MKFLALVLLVLISVLAFAGDSSGGGHARAIDFKKAGAAYSLALSYLPDSARVTHKIKVTAQQLDEALFSGRISLHILRDSDSLVIEEGRNVLASKGLITERGNPKSAYYLAERKTIYVGIDWQPTQTQLALKEFLRTIDGIDAESETIYVSRWYDQSYFGPRLAQTLLELSPTYEERKRTYKKEECEAARATFDPIVSRPAWRDGTSYRDVAKRSAPGGNIPLLEKSKLSEVWDYKWVKDEDERDRRRRIHQDIWDRTREAKRNRNIAGNIAEIVKYLDDAEMSGTATQALGEIGHPSAAEPLMALIQNDIDVVGTDDHYQEFVHKTAFWAPQALGSLDYSRAPNLYKKAEAKLFELQDAQTKVRFSITTMLDDGLVDLRSSRFVNQLKVRVIRGNVWQACRAIATIKDDYTFLMPLYTAAMVSDNERDFSAILKAMSILKSAFPHRGINQSLVWTDLVNKHQSFIQNGDVLISLVQLQPEKCE